MNTRLMYIRSDPGTDPTNLPNIKPSRHPRLVNPSKLPKLGLHKWASPNGLPQLAHTKLATPLTHTKLGHPLTQPGHLGSGQPIWALFRVLNGLQWQLLSTLHLFT